MKKNITLLIFIAIFLVITVTASNEMGAYTDDGQNEETATAKTDNEEEETRKSYEETTLYLQELVDRSLYLRWRLAGMELEDKISAESFMVAKMSDQPLVYLKKNSDRRYPLASITKLMSSVVAAENIDKNETIVLTEPMLRSYGHSPSLFPGARVRAYDLMMASLIQSTNDASECLTYFMDAGVFLELMNLKAGEIGMQNSLFIDAHGLSPHNRATAFDVVKLLEYIYEEHPEILEMTKVENFRLPDAHGRLLTFRNLNTFHNIPYFIGGKTGYLPEAKQTYTSMFNIGGEIYAVVILMSDNRRADLDAIFQWLNKNPRLRN